MNNVKETIARQLKRARENRGLTQSEVADSLKMERGSYAQYETGRNLIPIDRLFQVAKELGAEPSILLGISIGDLSSEEQELICAYRSLPTVGPLRRYAIRLVQALRQAALEENQGGETDQEIFLR